MQIADKGVLPHSFMDFSTPSPFAREALYFAPSFGHFLCDAAYRIDREYLEQYLMLYVRRGTLHVRVDREAAPVCGDQIALFDCRRPHSYWCADSVDFYWIHFNGCSSRQYCAHLYERFGMVHRGGHIPPLKEYFDAVINSAAAVLENEHQVSACIHSILSGLAAPEAGGSVASELLLPAITWIHNHYAESIALDDLADLSGVSKSHFIRSFRQYANCTPHEYLLRYRLRQAKRLLLSSDGSVEQIAEKCGFNSASHFARAFREKNGMSPTEFRVSYRVVGP